jgi:hypothetical protein
MKEKTMEIYCVAWGGTGRILTEECYFDKEYAEKRCEKANKNVKWYTRLACNMGPGLAKYYVKAITVKGAPKC